MKRVHLPYLDHLIILALAAACYLLFFHRLGEIGFLGPDEPRYSAVAREMYLTGDYVTPRLHGEPWFEKPVLMYWLAATGYFIFGINEWGARFPSALGATVCVLLVYLCGRRLWDRATGFLAALILASSIGSLAFARAASMDMLLTCCLTMALVFFLIASNDRSIGDRSIGDRAMGGVSGNAENGGTGVSPGKRRWWFYAFYASLGLGVLAKGPIALLLPAASLGIFLVLKGKLGEWKNWHPEGLVITAAVALPWYIACAWINGAEFVDVFLISHNLQRFTTEVFGHQRPFYFYLPVFLMLTFPWTFFLYPMLRRRIGRNEQILLWWVVVPVVFFSLSSSKLPGYILPIVPAVALLCAKELRQPSSGAFKTAVFIEAGMMAFIGLAFGFYGNMLNVDPHVSGALIAAITFGLAAVLSVIALWLPPSFLAGFNVITISAVVLVATNFVFPRFDLTDTMRPWDRQLKKIVPGNEVVFMYKPARWMEYGLQFYRYNNARGVFNSHDLVNVTTTERRVLCIAEDKTLDELTRLGSLDMEIVYTIGNQTAFWVWHTGK